MKEPILQDKRSEHIQFCKYCIELIERVTGSPVTTNLEASVGNLNKVVFCLFIYQFVSQNNVSQLG